MSVDFTGYYGDPSAVNKGLRLRRSAHGCGWNACPNTAPNLTVPAEAFTGTPATIQPTYEKLIACKKD